MWTHHLCPSSRRTPIYRGVLCSRIKGKGCEHDTTCCPTCTTPAHPTFRMPPFTRRPTCGTTHARHAKGGVRKGCARRMHTVSCAHAMWEGRPFPFGTPCLHALGFCVTPLHTHGAGRRGYSPVDPASRSHANRGRGACCAPDPILTSRGPCSNRGAAFSAPSWHGQRESRRGWHHLSGGGPPPVRALHSLAWVSRAQGAGVCEACQGGTQSGLGRLERGPSCTLACKAAGGGAGVHGCMACISLPVVCPLACT